MELVIISGRSGSGKSTALHQLEDEGYYAIDNLPASLLPALVETAPTLLGPAVAGVAVCIDARNAAAELHQLDDILQALPPSVHQRILYLDADDTTLIKRFSETRRRHPLSNDQLPLAEAIRREGELLEPLASHATLLLDTSQMNIHDLREAVRERLAGSEAEPMSLLIQSFGFKRGVPSDADLVFDVRLLPNPHWSKDLRLLSGLDQPVREFLEQHAMTGHLLQDLLDLLNRWLPHYAASNRSYMTVAIGCTGGQHRSVYMAQQLYEALREHFSVVHLRHRELRARA